MYVEINVHCSSFQISQDNERSLQPSLNETNYNGLLEMQFGLAKLLHQQANTALIIWLYSNGFLCESENSLQISFI